MGRRGYVHLYPGNVTTPTVKVIGGPRLRKTLKNAAGDLEDMQAVTRAVSGFVANRAKTAAPRRSGTLAGTVRGSAGATRATIYAGGGRGKARVLYAGPIHWGWKSRGITANPWISSTAQATESTWVRMWMDGVERAVSKVEGA